MKRTLHVVAASRLWMMLPKHVFGTGRRRSMMQHVMQVLLGISDATTSTSGRARGRRQCVRLHAAVGIDAQHDARGPSPARRAHRARRVGRRRGHHHHHGRRSDGATGGQRLRSLRTRAQRTRRARRSRTTESGQVHTTTKSMTDISSRVRFAQAGRGTRALPSMLRRRHRGSGRNRTGWRRRARTQI
jgi:hypothetical protein